MSSQNKTLPLGLKKIIKPLASLKLAVFVIISIAVITAIGTFVEARYDAFAAKKMVYDSVWMYLVMSLLVINLVAVILDRYPWKKHHLAFILAHIGIIVILIGGVLTFKFGLDGQLRIGIGEKGQYVLTSETDLLVYSSFDGQSYTKILDRSVDFFNSPPRPNQEASQIEIQTTKEPIRIIDYKPYILPKASYVASSSQRAGAALRFQIENANVKVVEWVFQRRPQDLATHEFGPATLFLGPAPEIGRLANEIYLTPQAGKSELKYTLYRKDSPHPFKTGFVKEGEVFQTGWMGLQVRVLSYLPFAEQKWDVQEVDRPSPLTTSAVKIRFKDREHWALLNDVVKLFTDDAVYLVSYGNRRIDLGFQVELKKFEIGHYQGTQKAMSYQSIVSVPDLSDQKISMNEPMKYKGLTFYQASFEQGPMGAPTASVFSVNHDPGRFLKYLGSIIMTLGIVMLFYFKKWYVKKRPESGEFKE